MGIMQFGSGQKKRRYARQKRAKHRSANDTLPSVHRAAFVSTSRGVRRGGSDAWPTPEDSLVLRGEVNRCSRVGSSQVSSDAGPDEDRTAARANGRCTRCREGHVVFRVERAWDVAC